MSEILIELAVNIIKSMPGDQAIQLLKSRLTGKHITSQINCDLVVVDRNNHRQKLEELIERLQDKHDSFIGNQKDRITSAEARGFKRGLAWAISSIQTLTQTKT